MCVSLILNLNKVKIPSLLLVDVNILFFCQVFPLRPVLLCFYFMSIGSFSWPFYKAHSALTFGKTSPHLECNDDKLISLSTDILSHLVCFSECRAFFALRPLSALTPANSSTGVPFISSEKQVVAIVSQHAYDERVSASMCFQLECCIC